MQALLPVLEAFESLECSRHYFDGMVTIKSLLVDSTSLLSLLSEAAEECDIDKKSDMVGRVILLSYISAVILLISYRHESASVLTTHGSTDGSSCGSSTSGNGNGSGSGSNSKDYLIRFDAGNIVLLQSNLEWIPAK